MGSDDRGIQRCFGVRSRRGLGADDGGRKSSGELAASTILASPEDSIPGRRSRLAEWTAARLVPGPS